MDNSATSFPKPEEVYLAVARTLRSVGGNPGRSGHRMSLAANRVVFETREAVARLLNVKDSSRVVFTSSATESLNLAIKGLLKPGDHVITSRIEHNSVTRPLHTLTGSGVELTRIAPDYDAILRPDDIRKAIKGNTKLIVLTHASNVIGAIEPAGEIGTIAREEGIVFLLDASQTAGVLPVDVQALNADMVAMPGHKGLLGPQGVGILYIGPDIILDPIIEGGTGGGPSSDEQPEMLPDRFEAGTMNTPGIAGLGAGVRYILERGVENIRAMESDLLERLIEGLREVDGIVIYGPENIRNRTSLVSFNMADMDPGMVSYLLDEDYGIMTRAGLHCAPDAHRFLKTFPEGCVRLSPGIFSTEDEVDRVISAVGEIGAGGKRDT